MTNDNFVFDAALAGFEQDVILKSKEVPVLVDFWAEWCGPCKALGPILEKLAVEFNGGFLLAKVDVDKEQQLAGYFQVKSIPTVMLLKDGQIVDGFPGALPENQLREFLKHHEVVAKEALPETPEEIVPDKIDPELEVADLRAAIQAEPDKAELKLDLMLALLKTGGHVEAEKILDALPANLAIDDRAIKAKARLAASRRGRERTGPQANSATSRVRQQAILPLGVIVVIPGFEVEVELGIPQRGGSPFIDHGPAGESRGIGKPGPVVRYRRLPQPHEGSLVAFVRRRGRQEIADDYDRHHGAERNGIGIEEKISLGGGLAREFSRGKDPGPDHLSRGDGNGNGVFQFQSRADRAGRDFAVGGVENLGRRIRIGLRQGQCQRLREGLTTGAEGDLARHARPFEVIRILRCRTRITASQYSRDGRV